MMIAIPGVARRRPGQIEAWPSDREFVRRQLAQDDRARSPQSGYARGIGRGGGAIVEDLRMAGGRQAGDIDDVLDPYRNSVQPPAQSPLRRLGFGDARLLQRGFRIDTNECVEIRVQPLDPVVNHLVVTILVAHRRAKPSEPAASS